MWLFIDWSWGIRIAHALSWIRCFVYSSWVRHSWTWSAWGRQLIGWFGRGRLSRVRFSWVRYSWIWFSWVRYSWIWFSWVRYSWIWFSWVRYSWTWSASARQLAVRVRNRWVMSTWTWYSWSAWMRTVIGWFSRRRRKSVDCWTLLIGTLSETLKLSKIGKVLKAELKTAVQAVSNLSSFD